MGRGLTAPRKEDAVVARIRKYLEQRGGVCFKIHGGIFQSAGIPDLYYAEAGHSFWFEVKLDLNHYGVTPLQQATIDKLLRQQIHVFVVTSTEEVHSILKEVLGQ